MPNFCLPPKEVDRFRAKLIDGSINPEKLATMTSEERRAFFEGITGKENARGVNELFESKLLLKNQQRGYITWAKNVTGMSPVARKDLLAKIQSMERVLDPTEEKAFLRDLAGRKLGVDVTAEEAKTIANLSREAEAARTAMEAGGDRLAYGRAQVQLGNYVSDLKHQARKLTPADYAKNPGNIATGAAGLAKAVQASLDNSAIFRQGWKTLFTNPVIWQKNARQSFVDIARQFGNKPVMDEIKADILSRDNAINGRYQKAGLATGTIEEEFPTHLPGKVPILGRAYKASESAYTGFVYRQRADIFDKYIRAAEDAGVNVDDPKQLQAIGKLVNSLTGRGNLGALERVAGTVNNVFFSPRFLKSNIDTLTAHQFQKGVTPFVRKQAAVNLLKVIAGTAGILATADAVRPGSVEWDPRSSDFGKIKIGDTRFDVSGGMSSIVTLAGRIMPSPGSDGWGEHSKSTTTGALNKLSSGAYGSQTGLDVVRDFFTNKTSPAAGVVVDLLKGQDHQGNKPSVAGEAKAHLTPLAALTIGEAKGDPNSAGPLIAGMADALGISANTYGKSTKNWDVHPSAAQKAFKQSVSSQDFKAANNEYNVRLDSWLKTIRSTPDYKTLSDTEKTAIVASGKAKIQGDVMDKYGFTYTKPSPDEAAQQRKSNLVNMAN